MAGFSYQWVKVQDQIYIVYFYFFFTANEIYFSDSGMPENPSDFVNTVRYLLPRTELKNDAYAIQSTAYAMMAHMKHNGMGVETETKIQRDSMMKWLNSMRNFIGGFSSTQVNHWKVYI